MPNQLPQHPASRGEFRLICAVLAIVLASAGGFKGLADSPALRGASGSVVVTPKALDFGPQTVGVAGQPKTAVLTNTGSNAMPIRDVTVSGIDFTETDTCQGSLAPGASCTIGVTFKPAITGPRLGAVIITASDPASPFMLVLSGVGQ
jgi:hypothetical protein